MELGINKVAGFNVDFGDSNVVSFDVTIDEYIGGGGTSNLLWRPNVTEDGDITWERNSTTVPPTPQNIQGPPGEPGKDGVITVATPDTLGGVKIGANLTITPEGVLSVDTAAAVEADNTKPITSAAVHTEVGNIEALLAAL